MTEDDLLQEIRAAFTDASYPGDEHIAYDNSGNDIECVEVKEKFAGKLWQSLSDTFLVEQRHSLPFFSHEGFDYYLPAFLSIGIRDFYGVDDLNDNLIARLTLPTETDVVLTANAIKMYKIDEQMPNIDFNEILQNQLRYKNRDVHNFIARFGKFSHVQGEAVKHYLEFIMQEYGDEYPQNEPATAIDRYWFQFA